LEFAQIPTIPFPVSPIPNNLGKVIRAEKLLDIEEVFRQHNQGLPLP
jgi:hypothetical protein